MRARSFSVLDAKAKAFLPPFFVAEVGQATRVFTDMVNEPGHQFAKHPEDYSLYEIGLFDNSTALLEPFGPEMVITATQCIVPVGNDAQMQLLDRARRDGHTGVGLDN